MLVLDYALVEPVCINLEGNSVMTAEVIFRRL